MAFSPFFPVTEVRVCIFCGESEKRLTAEHLYGDWISKALYPKRQPKQHRLWHRKADGTGKSWWSSAVDFKARLLCAHCNNEWFGDLENTYIKPIVEPIITQTPNAIVPIVTFTPDHQMALAAWVTKTLIVFNHMHEEPKHHLYSPATRSQFKDDLVPPNGVRIWLGHFMGNTPDSWAPSVGKLVRFKHDHSLGKHMRHVRHYVLTFSVRQFAVQISAIKRLHANAPPLDAVLDSPGFRHDPGWYPATLQIWPSPAVDLQWPPQATLLRGAFQDLANRFGGVPFTMWTGP